MTKIATILAIKGSPISCAAASVLSTLLGVEQKRLELATIPKSLKLPRQSILVLTVSQLIYLPALRLRGFSGAVLILASDSFASLKEKHRILRWGQGSYDTCEYPWTLPDLLTKVAALVPLEPENLKMLQNELKVPAHRLQHQVLPRLKRLHKKDVDLPSELDAISTLIEELRAVTPVACHAVVEIEGHSAQIQQHLRILIEEMRHSQSCDQKAALTLRQVFEQWRNIVLDRGENLGAFS